MPPPLTTLLDPSPSTLYPKEKLGPFLETVTSGVALHVHRICSMTWHSRRYRWQNQDSPLELHLACEHDTRTRCSSRGQARSLGARKSGNGVWQTGKLTSTVCDLI